MRKALIVGIVGFIISTAATANPHKCEINGRVIFQDAPCAGEVGKTAEGQNKNQDPESRELFDKVFIDQLKVSKGKERGEYTPVELEVIATNNTKNKIQLILKYDGLDEEGLVVDAETLIGSIDNNSSKKITNGIFKSKRTAIANKIVKWRFNSWKSSVN